jgi:hypothetical protein
MGKALGNTSFAVWLKTKTFEEGRDDSQSGQLLFDPSSMRCGISKVKKLYRCS